jgi:bifunctional non-homologous end joining protein LigD
VRKDRIVNVQGRLLKLSNLDKIFYPDGTTKRDIITYYQKIAATVLPHLRNRPFTLKRFPDGVESPLFFEKQCPSHRPKWVATGWFERVHHCLINDLPSLLWAVNLAAIELHTTLGKIEDPHCPDMIAFDLDPGEGADIRQCTEIALLLKVFLDRKRLESFPKTSGQKGLHIFVPINTPVSYEQTQAFARAVAEHFERLHPDLIVSKMSKKLRTNKVFIDWSQNVDFKTTVTAYSLRASHLPSVSTPVTWKEIIAASEKASQAKRLLTFAPDEVIRRIQKLGDIFEPTLSLRQQLPTLVRARKTSFAA